ncbi:MAG: hypothetical protein KAH17_05450 [Bacteroidales bacterium]|nr:hypothetical protein [Bacteroidales bacterium]
MNLQLATKEIKSAHVIPELRDMLKLLFENFKLPIPIQTLELDSALSKQLIIIFEGSNSIITEFKLDAPAGFSINNKGEGYLRLPEKKFLFSFWHHVMEDQGDAELKGGSCFIPFQPAFSQLRTAYDYFLNQEGRVTQGLNREEYINQLAIQGLTHVEVNGLGSPMGLENGPKGETYPMFYTYCPAMDQFVYSELNKGLYPFYYLSNNLEYMKQNAAMARKRGLVPGMLSFEPRSVPESFFQRYPMLRGARVDHPFRSFLPRYNMTITHPVVLNHYWEMTQKLIREVPDLGFFTIWTNDSGAGFEHTKSLYVGRNGGAYLVREWKDDQEIAKLAGDNALQFMRNILEAGREINPDFRVITRLESFYGEHDVMWDGFGNGLDVETASLVARGWDMPYTHAKYQDSKVLNGGGLHHQGLDPTETSKKNELKEKGANAAFYFGMGPQLMFAPLMGIPYPKLVWKRLSSLKSAEIEEIVVYGGTFPPSKVPYFANYEMLRKFQYDSDADPDELIRKMAEKWTGGKATEVLVNAWAAIEKAVEYFPNVSTLYNTIGFTWYRLWTRPLVPDIEAISPNEREYYEDMMCTTPHNPNNTDLSKDVLFNIASVEHCSKAMNQMDEFVWPAIDMAINLLGQAIAEIHPPPDVLQDQFIRTKALKCWLMTQRNVAAWVTGVHNYINCKDIAEKKMSKSIIDQMIDLEIDNMDELHDLFNQDIEIIALMNTGESPLMYGKDIQNQIRIKQDLMKKYRHLEPRIDPDYMMKKAATRI